MSLHCTYPCLVIAIPVAKLSHIPVFVLKLPSLYLMAQNLRSGPQSRCATEGLIAVMRMEFGVGHGLMRVWE